MRVVAKRVQASTAPVSRAAKRVPEPKASTQAHAGDAPNACRVPLRVRANPSDAPDPACILMRKKGAGCAAPFEVCPLWFCGVVSAVFRLQQSEGLVKRLVSLGGRRILVFIIERLTHDHVGHYGIVLNFLAVRGFVLGDGQQECGAIG